MRSQVSVEYMILLSLVVVAALVTVAGLIYVAGKLESLSSTVEAFTRNTGVSLNAVSG